MKIRDSYKIERNRQIYEDYMSNNTSYNQLAKKYGVSPQRVNFIINDLKNKKLDVSLTPASTKEQREKYKNRAVEMREANKLSAAVKMFKDIIEWDEANNNARGEMDALGHLKITLQLLADKEKDPKEKFNLMQAVTQTVQHAIDIGEKNSEIPEGPKTIHKVHLASATLDTYCNASDPKIKQIQLNKALEIINNAITLLPGSQAHKAWPMGTKAKILLELNRVDEALDTLDAAERCIYTGYEDEIKRADQADVKLNVWLAGIHLAKSLAYKNSKRFILAKHYANSVLNISDPGKIMGVRKDQAKRILNELKDIA